MAKDPAFLFYPGDYLRDTQMLSEKAQVAYDRIMCEHMRNICISQSKLNFLTKKLNDIEKEEVMSVLIECEGGFQIEWVALSICKRKDYSESRKQNRKGKDKKHMIDISTTYVSHMENENENENEIEVKAKEGVIGGGFYKPEDFDLLPDQYFLTTIEQMKIQKNLTISREQVGQMWFIFRHQQLAGDKYYNSKSDVYRHFSNWIKNQKFEQHGKLTKTQQRDQIMQQWIVDNITGDGIPPDFGY